VPPTTGINPAELLRRMLADDVYATVMLVLYLDRFGPEAARWHPEVVGDAVRREFGPAVKPGNVDRLLAALTISGLGEGDPNAFFTKAQSFVPLANVLAFDSFDPESFEPADALECAWAVTEALLLHPPDSAEPFGPEVRTYVGKVLADEGFVSPPDVLRIALGGDFSGRVRYDYADDPDLFAGIYAAQQGKGDEVASTVRSALLELAGQLETLPLRHGDAGEFIKRVRAKLGRPADKRRD
jgi:hypothetical protein